MSTTLPFGRTGHDSTRVIFGAAALGAMRQDRAMTTLDAIRAAGINHIDTAAMYGASEDRLQPWLADHRNEVFLATKTTGRTGDDARAELERSLQRMGVDRIDLIQLHNLIEPDDIDTAFAADGAVAALSAARDEGLVDHIGITAHGLRTPSTHLQHLRRFDFASVLVPLNFVLYEIDDYRREFDELLAYCADHQVAVQTIKAVARRRWADPDVPHFSWYEPLADEDAIERAVAYVLSFPNVFLNTTSDARVVPPSIEAARRFFEGDLSAPTAEALRSDVETYGITALFDGAGLERI
ncbi:MAG: aldo/keto reductase [Ilumatobacteraceae bacterium]|nr:aldo/keto reductase [Ilumatobacteraceae bacterium]